MEKHKGKHVSLEDTKEINFLFNKWSRGDQQAEAELIQVLYPYIHEIAHYQFKSKSSNGLQTTEIVNEAYLKLHKQNNHSWGSKQQFMAFISKVIRHVVIDHHRSENRSKRGGLQEKITLDRVLDGMYAPLGIDFNWLEIDGLLQKLEALDPRAAQVVEYKVFGGFNIPQIAELLSVSEITVSRDWKFARLWLLSEFK